jgi:hypothetical protein
MPTIGNVAEGKDLVGKLTKEEVFAAVPGDTFMKKTYRTWRELLDAIHQQPDYIKQAIQDASIAKEAGKEALRIEKRKKDVENIQEVRRTRRRLEGEWFNGLANTL